MSALLAAIRVHREAVAKDSADVEPLSDSDLLLELVAALASLTESTDAPGERIAIARTVATWFRPGPDCIGAMDLLSDAGIGDFEPEDLDDVRLHPAFAKFKNLLVPVSNDVSNDDVLLGDLYLTVRALAIAAGQPNG